jgi:hypothetical protein
MSNGGENSQGQAVHEEYVTLKMEGLRFYEPSVTMYQSPHYNIS